ncbi:DUF3347 domain-containing protein [Lewinella sp. IMCC34191]|uniref:DUF3347 domain-containing protein n=1 Tax=Lewinella sp. IMCC34191 TaxID=2259172 RepID=UPI000E260092|nr:DUF3347 domain-containing protein [Lewinella sp. IMCC34191]
MKIQAFFLIVLLSLALSGCGSDASAPTENATETGIEQTTPAEAEATEVIDVADAEFSDALIDKVFQNYLELRTALVNSNAATAADAAGNMADTFTDEREELRTLATQIAEAEELDIQRTYFAALTTEMERFFEDALSSGTIYKLHCPMAFDGEGADWYSEVSEIRNPYFGDKMLTCGRVEEEITGG